MSDNRRIAKNTLILYVRTIFVMVVSLYTSRITLQALGIEDYGIYNIVGGVVSMFSLITNALSSAISRYLTFEIGRDDQIKLSRVFSMSINILLLLSVVVFLLGETIGLWFINNQLNIPADRMVAANWVYQCSIVTFILSVLSVPYNALIVAHERMGVYAYVSIFEVCVKLLVAYILLVYIGDKLILFALLLAGSSLLVRVFYGTYCSRNFPEAKYCKVKDNVLAKNMTSFAGLSFFVQVVSVFNSAGLNVLINMFFGVAMNAARGVAGQVEAAVTRFVNDYMTALNPQITKSYAQGDLLGMYNLVIRGAKFSSYLFLILSLPIIIEADYILHLWLVEVPEHTVEFIRLSIIATMMVTIGNTGYTACMATGNIKRYTLWISFTAGLVFPVSYVALKLGTPAESIYVVMIIIYLVVDLVRLGIMKGLLDFPVRRFVSEVFFHFVIVTAAAAILPFCCYMSMSQSFVRFVVVGALSVLSSVTSIWIIGLTKNERVTLSTQIVSFVNSKLKK